jgi:hypothetical protein
MHWAAFVTPALRGSVNQRGFTVMDMGMGMGTGTGMGTGWGTTRGDWYGKSEAQTGAQIALADGWFCKHTASINQIQHVIIYKISRRLAAVN